MRPLIEMRLGSDYEFTPAPQPIAEPTSKPRPKHAPVGRPIPPIYNAMVLEVERRRLAVGISMDRMSELMGTAERSYSKMIYPDTSSGRMAQWATLQSALDVLFCDGFDLRMNVHRQMPSAVSTPASVRTTEGTKRLIKAEAATWSRPIRRELMIELGRKGGQKRRDMPPARRSEIARNAANARWAKVKQMEIAA